mgnify:CR=1 FL=1
MKLFYWLAIFIIFTPQVAFSKEPLQSSKFFTFTFENDLFVGEDNGYTNGMGITFGQGAFPEFSNDNLPDWLFWMTKDLYISKMENKSRGIAHMFFQRIQTPDDITIDTLIEDDVPYASLIAWQGTLYAWDENISDQLSFYLGAVGPIALGEGAQKTVHGLLDSDEPRGWDEQIRNEIIINVEVQRLWNLFRTSGSGSQFDVLMLASAGLGNLQSATQMGFAVRWGCCLQRSFSTFSLQADRKVNTLALSPTNDFYLFAGMRVGYLVNDIFIDGNTFRDSHSVPLEHIQNLLSAGVVWNIGRYGFVFQVSSSTSKTTLKDEKDNFGAISLTYSY